MAAATVTAGFAFAQFFWRRNTAKLDGLAHEAVDGFLDMMQFLLRFEETARDRIADEIFAEGFE